VTRVLLSVLFSDDFVPADPHVRVGGANEEDVEKAKAMILEFLDTKSTRAQCYKTFCGHDF